jgi:cell division inhibitor SulA
VVGLKRTHPNPMYSENKYCKYITLLTYLQKITTTPRWVTLVLFGGSLVISWYNHQGHNYSDPMYVLRHASIHTRVVCGCVF